MKSIFFAFAVIGACLLCLGSLATGQDYAEYDEPAPAPKPKLSPALQRSARGPVIGRPSPKSQPAVKSTTTTTTPEPEDVYDDELVDEQPEEQPTTTTEAPKKFLKGGVVRPFRSNTDLIEALKRRRQQVGQHGQVVSTTSSTAPPTTEKQFKNGRRNNSNKVTDQAGSDSNRKSSTANASPANRRFSPRTKPSQEPIADEPASEEVQPTKPSRLFAARARKF